jgi:hypothetical protein
MIQPSAANALLKYISTLYLTDLEARHGRVLRHQTARLIAKMLTDPSGSIKAACQSCATGGHSLKPHREK